MGAEDHAASGQAQGGDRAQGRGAVSDNELERVLQHFAQKHDAQLTLQRSFLNAMLIRLIEDMPGFRPELLLESLYVLLEGYPHSDKADQKSLRQGGAEELRALIEMTEEAIATTKRKV